MTNSYSRALLDAVEAATPPARPGARPGEIARSVGRYARVSVRQALGELVRQRRVAFDGPDCQRRYWRSGGPTG